MTTYFFTPPQRIQTIQITGSLICKFPVSYTVWKDVNGVWQARETPSTDELNQAQVVLQVSGRPGPVDAATAAELTAAGIGTITIE